MLELLLTGAPLHICLSPLQFGWPTTAVFAAPEGVAVLGQTGLRLTSSAPPSTGIVVVIIIRSHSLPDTRTSAISTKGENTRQVLLTGKALNYQREPYKLELADFHRVVIKVGGCHLKFTISLNSGSSSSHRD